MITLEAKSHHLKITIQLTPDPTTEQILNSPQYALRRRVEAICIGLRSELTMFLVELEKDIELE
jgi:hypothetical protein